MAVISVLRNNGNNVTKARNSTLSNIKVNGVDYHFAKPNEVVDGVCEDAVNEPIIDMKISGNSVQSILPSEYKQLDFIQSSDAQYIDTGYVPNFNTKVYAKFQLTSVGANYPFGVRETSQKNVCYIAGGASNWTMRFGASASFSSDFTADTELHEIEMSKNGIYFDNSLMVNVTQAVFNCTGNLYLFALNNNGSTSYGDTKMFEFKIWDNDVLIRHYVPCYRIADNVIGMYDLVNDEFYQNKTTTDFIQGEVAVPLPESPQEIISVGNKTSNYADLSKTTQSSSVSAICEFRYDNKTGTLELTSTPKKFDYAILYLQRDVGVELEVGKTYYCGAKVVVSGKQTTDFTKISFGVSTESKTSTQYFYDENGTYILNETFKYNGETNVRLNMHFNYSSDEYAKVTFENVYFSEINEFEPYGYKLPINLSNGLETTTTNIYLAEPLRKVGDYADYIDYKNKKIVRNVIERKISDITRWSLLSASSSGYNRFETPISDKLFTGTETKNILCECFRTSTYSAGENNTISERGNINYVKVLANSYSTLEEFLNGVGDYKMYYVLATPKEETIDIPTIETFDGTTTFNVETTIEPSEVKVNYWKQI